MAQPSDPTTSEEIGANRDSISAARISPDSSASAFLVCINFLKIISSAPLTHCPATTVPGKVSTTRKRSV
jgi:hypothetical protein